LFDSAVHTVQGHRGSLRSPAFSPDSKALATASTDGTAKIWRVSSGECVRTPSGHSNFKKPVVFSPDGQAAATVSGDGTAKIWTPSFGKCLCTLMDVTSSFSASASTLDRGQAD